MERAKGHVFQNEKSQIVLSFNFKTHKGFLMYFYTNMYVICQTISTDEKINSLYMKCLSF